jgi:hypothetical protein
MTDKKVKLIAKPNTWYKEGTEVFNYEGEEFDYYEYLEGKLNGMLLCRGVRICEHESELHEIGEEYIDGEYCPIEEFNVEVIDG